MMDMLSRFFRNQQGNSTDIKGHRGVYQNPQTWEGSQWRFKRHAERPFWQWVCSWARALRKPSDLGFEDGAFALPPLVERETIIPTSRRLEGELFARAAVTLAEQRAERRVMLHERCDAVAACVGTTEQALVWCHLNPEGKELAKRIPDAIEIAGEDTDAAKEAAFLAFAKGDIRVLITKPTIGAFGLNFQSCARMTFFPSHSFEQYYQGVRRCWRFGQQRPVTVDIIATEGEERVLANLQRKAKAADKMFAALVTHMQQALSIATAPYGTEQEEIPSWL
jgi:hypothetical protein